MFIGDSIQRTQWESMVCLIQSVIPKGKKSVHRNPPMKIFRAEVFYLGAYNSFASKLVLLCIPTRQWPSKTTSLIQHSLYQLLFLCCGMKWCWHLTCLRFKESWLHSHFCLIANCSLEKFVHKCGVNKALKSKVCFNLICKCKTCDWSYNRSHFNCKFTNKWRSKILRMDFASKNNLSNIIALSIFEGSN